jgi:hypothetical protein
MAIVIAVALKIQLVSEEQKDFNAGHCIVTKISL